MRQKSGGVICAVMFFFVSANFAFAQEVASADVINALEENFSRFAWVYITKVEIYDDYDAPSIQMIRSPYVRSTAHGRDMNAENVHIKVIVDGFRYELSIDFFDAIRPEPRAHRSQDAKRLVFNMISGMFPKTEEKPE